MLTKFNCVKILSVDTIVKVPLGGLKYGAILFAIFPITTNVWLIVK